MEGIGIQCQFMGGPFAFIGLYYEERMVTYIMLIRSNSNSSFKGCQGWIGMKRKSNEMG
jgi:hypothetical protein